MLSPFSKTIGRLAFLLRSGLVFLLFAVAVGLLVPDVETSRLEQGWEQLAYVVAIAVEAVWLVYAVIPRCRDVGLKWWFAFGMLIPVLNLFLFLVLLVKPTEIGGGEDGTESRMTCANCQQPLSWFDRVSGVTTCGPCLKAAKAAAASDAPALPERDTL